MNELTHADLWPQPHPATGDGSEFGETEAFDGTPGGAFDAHTQPVDSGINWLEHAARGQRAARAPRSSSPFDLVIPAVNTRTGAARYSSRRGRAARLLIVHTAEGATSVAALGGWFRNPSAPDASSHAGADDQQLAEFVDPSYSAWTARSANPVAEQIELCAFARWTAADWAAHPGLLENCARWLAARSSATGIPLVRLSAAQSVNGTGVIEHVDVTRGWHDGSHTDCGDAFPLDSVIARARVLQGLPGGGAVAAPPVAVTTAPAAPTQPAAAPVGGRAPQPLPVLHSGDSSGWVILLQRALGGLATDGKFGPATAGAVAAAQRDAGLTVDSVVGPQTWALAVLARGGVLQQGSTGVFVEVLQNYFGWRPGSGLDGDFGPATRAALEAVQAWGGIPADGIAGPQTRSVLVRA
jgi:peptidoglycan hydrolase-like protein with peptidoglycan-binding domain